MNHNHQPKTTSMLQKFFKIFTITTLPIAAIALLIFSFVQDAEAATTIGDSFGYFVTDSTDPNGPIYNFEDISSTGTPIALVNNTVSGAIPIGFSFDFYTDTYSSLYIAANGFVTFLPNSPGGCCTGDPIPLELGPNGLIAAWWEFLLPSFGGTVHYETLGSAPNRYFIVQYTDVPNASAFEPNTFQIKLFEEDNRIEVHYAEVPPTLNSSTAGIENVAGTDGVEYAYHNLGLSTPLAVRYALAPIIINKTVSADRPFPGDTISYTIKITNRLTDTTLTGGILSDTLPTGLSLAGPIIIDPPLAGTIGTSPHIVTDLTLAPEEMVTVTVTAVISPLVPFGTTIINNASIAFTEIITPYNSNVSIFVDGPEQVGETITVNSSDDGFDGSCTEGHCTLEEAINAANTIPEPNIINVPAGTYDILYGLPITDSVTINGDPNGGTILDGDRSGRIFFIGHDVTAVLNHLTIQNGRAYSEGPESMTAGKGGGIHNQGTLSVTNSLIFNNAADYGGGIYNSVTATLSIVNSHIFSNTAGSGGGIYNKNMMTATESTFEQNSAYTGGGIYGYSGSSSWVTRSTINNNFAYADGGGLYNDSSEFFVTNTTLSGNKSNNDGGGLFMETDPGGAAATILFHVTTYSNTADFDASDDGDGGGMFIDGGEASTTIISMTNSILAGNFDQSPIAFPAPDCGTGGEVNPATENNLIGNNSSCTDFLIDGINGNIAGESGSPITPVLGLLQDNGGATKTHLPSFSSPAVDAIATSERCEFKDQRNRPRPVDSIVDGIAQCDMGAVEAYPANIAWPVAYPLSLTIGLSNTQYTSITHYVDSISQSRWYKVRIYPGSTLMVDLSNLPANYDLTLYKDISETFASLIEPQGLDDLTQLTAEFAPDAFAPDAFAPDAFAPDAFAPDAFAPDAFAPDAFAPDAFAPDAFAPDAFAPDAFAPDAFAPDAFAPDAFAPDAFAPDAFAPDAFAFDEAYTSAQTRSIIGISAFDGLSDEILIGNTWDNTGDYYIRVRGRNGAFNDDDSFQLDVTLVTGICDGVDFNMPPSSIVPIADGYETIILTDYSRMDPTDPLSATMQARIDTFAALPEIGGVVVDVNSDTAVNFLNQQADNNPSCPQAKNLVASAIKRIVDLYRDENPTLEYAVIVGNDDVIPFFRYPDRALLANEKNYVPPVHPRTASYASLKLGYFLSQDEYGSSNRIPVGSANVPIPNMAVGRLVETASDVISVLDAYNLTDSGLLPTPDSALVTGYDFLEDASLAIQAELENSIGTPATTLIADRDLSPLDPLAWTANDLDNVFLQNQHDIVFLAGHFSAYSALAADYRSRLLTTDLLDSPIDMRNALIYSVGCHSGYNTVNEHGIPSVTFEPDWAQAFAQKGAIFIGGTGYQYGDTDFIKYSEQLYLLFTQHLRAGTGPVSIGQALMEAKLSYLAETPDLQGIPEKSVLESTLFGLPMLKMDLPFGRGATPTAASVIAESDAYASDPGLTLGLNYADFNVTPDLISETTVLSSVNSSQALNAIYFRGANGVLANPTKPILPMEIFNVSLSDYVLRGVGLRGATYTDYFDIVPLTGGATTEIRAARAPFLSEVFFPIQTWQTNYFGVLGDPVSGTTNLTVIPGQFKSNGNDVMSGTMRIFDEMDLRLFYSNNITKFISGAIPSLAAPPDISKILATSDGSSVDFEITVLGDPTAGIQEVWVTYTLCDEFGICNGIWESIDLTQKVDDSRVWIGELAVPPGIPHENIHYIVQAVNGVGLVSLATNLGEFYRPNVDLGAPAAIDATPTILTFVDSPTSGRFNSTVTFYAELTTMNGEPLSGERIRFGLGTQQRSAFTNEDGLARVRFPILSSPNQRGVQAGFAGTATLLPSTASSAFTVEQMGTDLTLGPEIAIGQYSDDVGVRGQLLTDNGRPLREQSIFFTARGPNGTASRTDITNFISQAHLGPIPVPSGTYTITANFYGVVPLSDTLNLEDINYGPSSDTSTLIVIPENALIEYLGDVLVEEGVSINLISLVSQENDGTRGDLRRTDMQFTIRDSSGDIVLRTTGDVTRNGVSQITAAGLGAGTYTIELELIGNGYFDAPDKTATLTVQDSNPPMCSVPGMYGAHDAGGQDTQLFFFDLETEIATPLGPLYEDYDIEAMDIHPESRNLFAIAGNGGSQDNSVFKIDKSTGAITLLGIADLEGENEIVAAAFHPDGSLWVFQEDVGILTLDLMTDTTNLTTTLQWDVNESGFGTNWEGLAWNRYGTELYATHHRSLFRWNPETETAVQLCGGNFLPGPTEALDFRSDGALLAGLHDSTNGSLNVYLIDYESCQIESANYEIPYNDVESVAFDACVPEGMISGHVTADNGELLENVGLTLIGAGPNGIIDTLSLTLESNGDDVIFPNQYTDENGDYVFSTLPSDIYIVQIDESTLPPETSLLDEFPLMVDLEPGEQFEQISGPTAVSPNNISESISSTHLALHDHLNLIRIYDNRDKKSTLQLK